MRIDRKGKLPPIENQRSEPKCVGFAFRALAYEAGYDVEAQVIYEKAQQLDNLPGEDYGGTQLIGGVRMLNNIQLSDRLFEVHRNEVIIKHALNKSCVVVAVRMDYLGGEKSKWHAVVLCGYDPASNTVLVRNSWGRSWGHNGYKWVNLAEIIPYLDSVGYAIMPNDKTKSAKRRKSYIVLAGIAGGALILATLAYFLF